MDISLDQVKLTRLMERTRGRPEISVGLIDGPVDKNHPDLIGANLQEVSGRRDGCDKASSTACLHGTFIAGIFCGKRDLTPAICPDCTILIRPIFAEGETGSDHMPSATPDDLATAIVECIDAGARVLNLSLALSHSSGRNEGWLKESLDYAARKGVIVVAAAGNQGIIGSSVITGHPWVIPVIAYDFHSKPLGYTNLGKSIGTRGLGAPGENVMSLGVEGQPLRMSGTSVAVPFVTGAIGLLWSEFPGASAAQMKLAISLTRGHQRAALVPPLLNAWSSYELLAQAYPAKLLTKGEKSMDKGDVRDKVEEEGKIEAPTNTSTSKGALLPAQAPVTGVPGAGCGASAGDLPVGSTMGNNQASPTLPVPPSFVYALGRIEPRFPSLGVEKEFAQATGRTGTKALTEGEALKKVLSQPDNRYLSRMLCWVFTVEGLDTYLLQPTCFGDFNLLVEAVRPVPRHTDVDLIIGTLGPLAPPEMCNGLMVPIVIYDKIYPFEIESLIATIPRPEKIEEERLEVSAEEVFSRIIQIADNAGAMDEHRALNYLAVRYPAIYHKTAEYYDRNASLSSVDVHPSRLSGTRKVVQVIFSFTDRVTGVTEKWFVRVDVTEKWPFLVTPMSQFYDR